MKKQLYISIEIFFLIVASIVIYALDSYFQTYEDNYLETSVRGYKAHVESVMETYRNITTFVYKNILSNKEILNNIDILSESEEIFISYDNILTKNLRNNFNNLKDIGFKQFKIINTDEIAIAKMFMSKQIIEDNEDSIENISAVEKWVLKNEKYYEGIDMGINFSSLRFAYPITVDDDFKGILEFNLPYWTIGKKLSSLYEGYYKLYINSDELEGKEIDNYKKSTEFDGYFKDITVEKENIYNDISIEIVEQLDAIVDNLDNQNIDKATIISHIIDNESYHIVLMPYKNLDNNLSAYLILYIKDDYGLLLNKTHKQSIMLVTLIFGGFIAAIHLLFKYQVKYKNLSLTDTLTQINNRSIVDKFLLKEINISLKKGIHFYGIMLDIDYFKSVNDNYGHQVGDHVLIGLSHILKQNVKKSDTIIRWGGEEFFILLKDTDNEESILIANRLKTSISNYDFGKAGNITVSMGVTKLTKDETFDEFIKRADDFLYLAKTNGRNRIEY